MREWFRGETGDVTGSLAWAAARLGVIPNEQAFAHAARVRLQTERVFAEVRDEVVPLFGRLRGAALRIGVISDCTAEFAGGVSGATGGGLGRRRGVLVPDGAGQAGPAELPAVP